MKQARIVPLDTGEFIDPTAIGPKAMSLVRLGRVGVAVPAAFCITEKVFREHIEQSNLKDHVKSVVEQLAKTEPGDRPSLLADLRKAIAQAPMAEKYRSEIEAGYRALQANHVAVRSSAAAEDMPGHSFAGQYDTYLGVSNVRDCIDAVKKCWASLWTQRAYEYRERNGFDHLKVSMAAIVQSLVDSDTSGVMFTSDPVTGSRSSIVIEACFGLGQALVSGKVTPDRFVLSKKKLRLRNRIIGEKKIECILDGNGLAIEQALSNRKSATLSLNERQARRLAGFAVKVETEFGCPQDIEWAISNRKIYFLQSRPITALPPEKSWEDRQIWCSSPAKEVMPDVVTPASLSLIEAFADGFMNPFFNTICMDCKKQPIYGMVAGRIYFNANIWGTVFRELPVAKNFDLMEGVGDHKDLQQIAERLRNAEEEDLPDLKFSRLKFFLKLPLLIIGALRNTPEKGRRILVKVDADYEKWAHLEVESLSNEEIITCCQKIMTEINEIIGNALYLISILIAFPILHIVCKKWFPDGNTIVGKLLAGVGGMSDAVAGLDIWRLAVTANSKAEIKDLIMSNDNWPEIESKLSQTDSGREFLTEWNRFMSLHGHHCRGELELYNKRWSETPNYILKFVRSHITQIDKMDPVQKFQEVTQQRKQLEKQCREQLRNPIKRFIFNHLLARVQNGSVFRENIKSEIIKLFAALRKLLLELGKRLSDEGVLNKNDDIFFLKIEEITPIVHGNVKFDVHKTIADRRTEYDKNCSVAPPSAVIGKFDPDNYVPDIQDEKAQVLNGFGVSPGKATGKARVILRADTEEQLLAGEILVAPFTDPGWTPYFVPAAAIVMDEGGVISHGSIVAREYGIPAVVNVGGGTRIIKTGQTIQVDGEHGLVRILQ